MNAFYDVNEAPPAACSSVRNGRYYGRNLDYYINGNVDFIITTTAGKDRFASIGTSADYPRCTLEGLNIVLPSHEKFPFEEHWMISDAEKTVVVEIWDNEIVVVDDNAMTNFYVSHPDSEMGIGHERYEILKANYNEVATAEGMQKLMKRVWYSNAYSSKVEPLWYSDCLEDGCGFTWSDIKAGNIQKAYETILEEEKEYVSVDFQKSLRSAVNWYTTHSIVYDLEAKTMSLIAQENDTVWNFSL